MTEVFGLTNFFRLLEAGIRCIQEGSLYNTLERLKVTVESIHGIYILKYFVILFYEVNGCC